MLVKAPKCKVNDGSTYCREGQWVIAKYMDSFWITGIVKESRVKLGGRIGHTIVSDSPTIILENNREDLRPIGTIFLVEEQNITIAQKEF
jgi:hypothetical protein